MATVKSVDKKSPLTYEGRHIKIVSDGTGYGTHIYVDEKEITNVISLKLSIDAQKLNIIDMVMFDFDGKN